jgi:hypothetical protein
MEAQAAELVASYVHNSLPVGAKSLCVLDPVFVGPQSLERLIVVDPDFTEESRANQGGTPDPRPEQSSSQRSPGFVGEDQPTIGDRVPLEVLA